MRLVVGLLLALAAVACTASPPMAATTATSAIDANAPSGMAIVAIDDLPPEASDTLALIDTGGPFPYRQDGAVFQNREGLLPDRAGGHYREYTVATPGSDDRGPRRIVAGADGELYWTDDHYDSFSWIAR